MMSPETKIVDLKELTVKEHLILLNEKITELKQDTESLKNNDKNKWKAIGKNERRIDEIQTTVKIYIFFTGILMVAILGGLCKLFIT